MVKKRHMFAVAGLAAALALYTCRGNDDRINDGIKNLPSKAAISLQSEAAQIMPKAVKSLEEEVLEAAGKQTGLQASDFKLREGVYHSDNFPFGTNYRTGKYLFATNQDDSVRVFFSVRGDYIGVTRRVEGEPHAWTIDEHDKDGTHIRRFKYLFKAGVMTEVYADVLGKDGLIKRYTSKRPVYKISNGSVIKEKRPYGGLYFGGDGQYCLNDRDDGLFFVVLFAKIDPNTQRVVEESGEFFNVKPDYKMGDCSVEVIRKSGSNKFIFDDRPDRKDQYDAIVPKRFQEK